VGRASRLGRGELEFFEKEYPDLDLGQVWVLEKGREPSRAPRRLMIFGLGIAACVGGALMWGDKAAAYEEPF